MAGGGSGDRPPWKEAAPPRPTISLPPRAASMDTLFNGGFSPGPMTLLSGFLTDGDDCNKSFSQLLAGAMASPVAAASPGLFSPSQVLNFFLSLVFATSSSSVAFSFIKHSMCRKVCFLFLVRQNSDAKLQLLLVWLKLKFDT